MDPTVPKKFNLRPAQVDLAAKVADATLENK
jgi:hypothetical protein